MSYFCILTHLQASSVPCFAQSNHHSEGYGAVIALWYEEMTLVFTVYQPHLSGVKLVPVFEETHTVLEATCGIIRVLGKPFDILMCCCGRFRSLWRYLACKGPGLRGFPAPNRCVPTLSTRYMTICWSPSLTPCSIVIDLRLTLFYGRMPLFG